MNLLILCWWNIKTRRIQKCAL